MSANSPSQRVVRCPACAAPTVYAPGNPWRPFCSERCRNHDFGAWASEGYRVPEDEPETPAPDDGAAPRAH